VRIRPGSSDASRPSPAHARSCEDAGTTLEELLELARKSLVRLDPGDAERAMREGAVLVDIRTESQRERDGVVPGSLFIARNVLEWRCAPSSSVRDARVSDPELRVIVMCDGGYQSSLAAATLQRLGLPRATDLAGGFQAWLRAGLPVELNVGGRTAARRFDGGHMPGA
jgi:rhodanese-related sulfurtransferase